MLVIETSGKRRASPTTRSIRFVLCGGGGGGAAPRFGSELGPAGKAGETLEVTVNVEPGSEYECAIGQPGAGGDGIGGGRSGGDTLVRVGDAMLVARGGAGGRESGVYAYGLTAVGGAGTPGVVAIEERDQPMETK